jgi:hypothetical protein
MNLLHDTTLETIVVLSGRDANPGFIVAALMLSPTKLLQDDGRANSQIWNTISILH